MADLPEILLVVPQNFDLISAKTGIEVEELQEMYDADREHNQVRYIYLTKAYVAYAIERYMKGTA